jgi:N4-(beta-N-acetylglucosaminyl)-L-asparaginase
MKSATVNRRNFLHFAAITTPLLAFKNRLAATGPVMISTWDEGKNVNAAGWPVLQQKGRALDAIEAGAIYTENQPSCCVGLGAYPDRDGIVTLDACVMDEQANIGAVAGVERIKHPLSLARKLMETTPHVLLVGQGAQQFALENGFTLEPAQLSADATKAWQEWLKKSEYKPTINIENKKNNGPFAPSFFEDGKPNHDTMGMLALDAAGNLSGGVTTSGMAFKIHGRVGDSAGIGAGLFVDNEVGAATSSGVGEEVIRICGTHLVVELMRQGFSPQQACKKAVERIIRNNPAKAKNLQVGFVAINKKGQHGAWAIQKGFTYAIKSASQDMVIAANYFYQAP